MKEQVLRPIDAKDLSPELSSAKKDARVILLVYTLLVILGVGTGYMLTRKGSTNVSQSGEPITGNKVIGVQDASTFKDCATGKIEKDGIEGEGTHKLIREGGPSQTAYLMSSVIDLDQYVGVAAKVCGQTFAAKKVSWLMDVGRLELE
ncbi:MAG TPA: hypothetical protein VJB96_01390 [Patescibacteria group bacterium]|nr:hypothetical protein [Patescibacteria group bacterium]